MERKPRFACPSIPLTLMPLFRQTRKVLWITFGVALALHLSLTQWRGFAQENRAIKPLTTQFIKRQPRLSKPLELKKRLQPKRRQIQRKMVAVKARESRERTAIGVQPMQVVRSLARPRA